MYDHYFGNFGSPPVPEYICKDSAIRHARFWRRRFLKFFPYKCIGKQTWHCRKKVKRQRTTILLEMLVDLTSLMIPAKVQPQDVLGSREEDFYLPYMGVAAILVNGPQPF